MRRVVATLGGWLPAVLVVAAPWYLFGKYLRLGAIPVVLVVAWWWLRRATRPRWAEVLAAGVAFAAVAWLAIRFGALPEEGGEGRRVKAAVVLWTVGVGVALRAAGARRVVATNLAVLAAMLALGEGAVRLVAPQEREEARWAELAAGYPEAPRAVDSPIVSMDDDRRLTVDNPLEPDRRVVIFGGSTTFAAAVDDADTWASVLQRRLNDAGLAVRVDNFGVQGAAVMHMPAWVEREIGVTIRRGDVVVVYAGVNEAKNAILFRGNFVERLRRRHGRLDAVIGAVSRRSDLAFLAERTLNTGTPTIEESSFSETEAGLARIRALVEGAGARLVTVLQPHAFVRANPTRYERAIRDSMGAFPAAVDEVYPRIGEILLSTPGAIDARAMFDDFDGSPYLDWCHVGVTGNRAIGDWMAERLLPMLRAAG